MWTPITFYENELYHWKTGTQDVYIQRSSPVWKFALSEQQEPTPLFERVRVTEELTEELEWESIADQSSSVLHYLPALPDRPIVIKPKSLFKIVPEQSVKLFISVPYCLQFYSGKAEKGKAD